MAYMDGNEVLFSAGVNITEVVEKGDKGDSAYDIAVDNGFEGTEEEWLASLKGEQGIDGIDGVDGMSAYDIAVDNGFEGTEEEWLASLKGEKGDTPTFDISAELEKYAVKKQNSDRTYPRAYVDFGYDPENNEHIGDGYLNCSMGSLTKGVNAQQYKQLARFTNRGTLVTNDPEQDFEVVNKRTLDKGFVENKAYIDHKAAELVNIMALVNNKATKEVNITDYFGDKSNREAIDVFVRNTVGGYNLDLGVEWWIDCVDGSGFQPIVCANILAIPRKPLQWDVPVECKIIEGSVDFVNGTVSDYTLEPQCTLTLTSDDCSLRLYIKVRGTYLEEIYNEEYDMFDEYPHEFDTHLIGFAVPEMGLGGEENSAKVTVALTEEIAALLPTNYSLRRDLTDLELETLEKINNNGTES